MQAYRLYTVMPRLVHFIDQLTNWFVRLNRERLKGGSGEGEAQVGLCVLYEVLLAMAMLMAPFTPYFAEYVYQKLRLLHPQRDSDALPVDAVGKSDSVHYLMLPTFDEQMLNEEYCEHMRALQAAVDIGRVLREQRKIQMKTLLRKVVIVASSEAQRAGLEVLKPYLLGELNAWEVELTLDQQAWATFSCLPDSKKLGKRLGKACGAVRKAIKELSHEQIVQYLASGAIDVAGATLGAGDLIVSLDFQGDEVRYAAGSGKDKYAQLLVVLDTQQDAALLAAGTAREVVNRVQKMRKAAGLVPADAVEVFMAEEAAGAPSTAVADALRDNRDFCTGKLRTVPVPIDAMSPHAAVLARDAFSIDVGVGEVKTDVTLVIARPQVAVSATATGDHDERTIASLLASLDLASGLGDSVRVTVDGAPMELQRGTHFFGSALERLARDAPDNWGWAL